MRMIYLSPHLDDAVLSAGGLIRAQADEELPVEVWTFMAGFPDDSQLPDFAQVMHQIWGFYSGYETIRSRREEDLRATEQVGAKAVHFDFLDCIYRRGRQGEALYSDVTLPVQPDDAELPGKIAEVMAANLRPDDRVFCQLGIGRHVDHFIVRQAAESLHRRLTYIADMPYVLNHPDELPVSVTGFKATFHPVDEAGFRVWLAAIRCYASQVDSVFGSHDEMNERMQAFWQERRGIETWEIGRGSRGERA